MQEPIDKRAYEDIEGMFRLKVPLDWLLNTLGDSGTRVAFISDRAETDFRANVNVVVQRFPPLTKEEFLTLSRLQLKSAAGVASLPVDQPDEQGAAHCFEWLNNHAPIPVRVQQRVYFSRTKAFILSATALESNFDAHRDTFRDIFMSFHLNESPAASF